MSSFLPTMVYGLLGAGLILIPYILLRPPSSPADASPPVNDKLCIYALLGFAIVLTALRGIVPAAGVLLITAASWGKGPRALAGAAAAALIVATTTWWLLLVAIPPVQQWLTAFLCLSGGLLARQCSFEEALREKQDRRRGRELLIPGCLFVLSLSAAQLTGSMNSEGAALFAWHHWGAYLSPVYSLLGGAVPYRDFPVQYGMGPTLLIAAACQSSCWSAVFWAAAIANALLLAAFGWIAVLLTRNMGIPSRLLALAAVAAATFCWTGYPLGWLNPVSSPSVGGLRFLPLALIAALILTIEAAADEGEKASRAALMAGYALWLLSLGWSPEAGLFATLAWWPWLALGRADLKNELSGRWRTLISHGLLAVLALVGSCAMLAVLFHAAFGYWVAPNDFLYYQLNPPSHVPVDKLGAIWFAVTVFFFACIGLWRSADQSRRRVLYGLAVSGWAAFSYFISRSHDSNVINLMPWLVVVMLAAQRALPSDISAGFLRAVLVGLIALVACFRYPIWSVHPGAPQIAGLQVGPSAIIERFKSDPRDPDLIISDEAATLYSDLRREGARGVVLLDWQRVMLDQLPSEQWTLVNNGANFQPLPPQEISRFAIRGVAINKRGGWLIISNDYAARWLGPFSKAYLVKETRTLGAYTAYHMLPR